MTEKEQVLARIRALYIIHNTKAEAWRQKHGYSNDVGCLTRESMQIAILMPRLTELGIDYKDLK